MTRSLHIAGQLGLALKIAAATGTPEMKTASAASAIGSTSAAMFGGEI